MNHLSNSPNDDAGPALNKADRGSNQSGMRAHNERLVLSLIRQSGAMAKAHIAQQTGLSAQTVSVIMRSLEADGLLERGEPVRGKIGQPLVPMSLNRNGAFFLGLKIGWRRADLVLTDFLGQILHRLPLHFSHPTPDGIVRFAQDAIADLIGLLPEEHRSRVSGLGIALPFQLWDWATLPGVDAAAMDEWRVRDIAAEIGAEWDFPVLLCNDASAACGAELVFGDQDKPRDFLYFYVGFFIGGGLVLDNKLFTGQSGNAAALGSLPIAVTDGNMRQLVDIASLVSLEVQLAEQGINDGAIWNRPDSWDLPEEAVSRWLDDAANGLAQAILSSTCVIDFECAVIDGWFPEKIRQELVKRTGDRLKTKFLPGITTPDVREGSVGVDAGLLGAASLPLSERFLLDRTSFLKG